MPTPTEINELTKDWFVRDEKTFVLIPEAREYSWEKSSNDYDLLISKKPDTTIRNAYRLLQQYIKALGIKQKITIRLAKEDSYTDGKSIYVATDCFDSKVITTSEAIDVFLGLGTHEGAHCLFTDFSSWSSMKIRLIHSIANLYEDERIERLLVEHLPGTVRFLESTKYYYFDVAREELDKSKEPPTELSRILDTLWKIIRYPKYLEVAEIEYFADYLSKIKEVLTPYPESTAEVITAAEATYEIIKGLIKETDPKFELMPDEEFEKFLEELAKKFLEIMGAIMIRHSEDATKIPTPTKLLSKYTPAELAEELEVLSDGTFLEVAEEDDHSYRQSLERVRRFIPAVQKVLKYNDKDYKVTHKGARSGSLDLNKLPEAIQGVPTVYETYGKVKSERVAVCLLIDESGSMGNGSKIEAAMDCAVLLAESILPNNSIDLFIYGHTAEDKESYKVDLFAYMEPGIKKKLSRLGSIQARSNNRDGDAILAVAKRVRKFSNRKCLMFVMSDGQPASSGYSGEVGIKDTKNKVKMVEKMGFDVVQIAIEHTYEPSTMFDKYIIFDDLSTLPLMLGKFVKKSILHTQKISIT